MAAKLNGDPQLSWGTVLGMATAGAIMIAGSWAVFQTQFAGFEKQIADRNRYVDDRRAEDRHDLLRLGDEVKADISALQVRQFDMISRSARNPVEGGELKALIDATDKRLDVVQQQIADINRQIAAAILLGSSGEDKKKALAPP